MSTTFPFGPLPRPPGPPDPPWCDECKRQVWGGYGHSAKCSQRQGAAPDQADRQAGGGLPEAANAPSAPPATRSLKNFGRDLTQNLAALAKANEVREYRAAWKGIVRHAQPTAAAQEVADLIARPLPWALTWRVEEVLRCVPGIGVVKVRHWMMQTRTSHSRTLGGLSRRQRIEIVELVQSWRWAGYRRRVA